MSLWYHQYQGGDQLMANPYQKNNWANIILYLCSLHLSHNCDHFPSKLVAYTPANLVKKKKDDMLIECVCVCVCTFNVKGGIGFESSTAGITVNRTFDMERCCSNRENQRKDTEGECHQQQHPRCHEYFCIWLIVNKLMVVEQYLYCERTWAFADYIS